MSKTNIIDPNHCKWIQGTQRITIGQPLISIPLRFRDQLRCREARHHTTVTVTLHQRFNGEGLVGDDSLDFCQMRVKLRPSAEVTKPAGIVIEVGRLIERIRHKECP